MGLLGGRAVLASEGRKILGSERREKHGLGVGEGDEDT